MLRVSTQVSGDDISLQGIVEGNDADTGIPAGDALIDFAEKAMTFDADAIARAREEVKARLGEPAMIDAAGVIANFQRMVRIADGTGIPLDTPVAVLTDGIREDLGINDFGSAENTPPLSFVQKIFSRLVQPLLPFMIRRATRNMVQQDN